MSRWHDLGRHVLPARHVRCEWALVVDNGKTKMSLSRSSRTNDPKSPANAIWRPCGHLMKYGHYPTCNTYNHAICYYLFVIAADICVNQNNHTALVCITTNSMVESWYKALWLWWYRSTGYRESAGSTTSLRLLTIMMTSWQERKHFETTGPLWGPFVKGIHWQPKSWCLKSPLTRMSVLANNKETIKDPNYWRLVNFPSQRQVMHTASSKCMPSWPFTC